MSIEWNGEGLPPEGCECELYDCERWIEVKIKYIGDYVVVVHEFGSSTPERVFHLAKHPDKFRPLRTEAERKRDDRIASLDNFISGFMESTDGDHAHLGEAIYEWLAVLDRLK